MKNSIQQALAVLAREMQELGVNQGSIIDWTKMAIQIHDKCLMTLKSIVTNRKFISATDEVEFFKRTKPAVLGDKLFYHKLASLESRKPLSAVLLSDFLSIELTKAQSVLQDDMDFYSYLRAEKTYLDELYFLRQPHPNECDSEFSLLCCDSQFTTGYDLKVAMFNGNKRLIEHLSSELSATMRNNSGGRVEQGLPNWKWTESKIALVELVYALNSSRCINNGKVDIKEIACFFESVFNTNLGDIYHNFLQVKGRQCPTKFIDSLRNCLLQRMEE